MMTVPRSSGGMTATELKLFRRVQSGGFGRRILFEANLFLKTDF